MTPTVANQYSVRLSNERYDRQVGVDYEIAFAVKLVHLISEMSFYIPHPDVRREEFYFSNEYVINLFYFINEYL